MIPRTAKDPEEIMKAVMLSPNSSVESSTTTAESDPFETRGSSYFPGCKKDANCSCKICIASFNATLDLMPQSAHRSSLTKLSVSRPKIRRSPVTFASSADASTPMLRNQIIPNAIGEKVEMRKGGLKYEGFILRLLLGLIVICGLDFAFSWAVSGVLKSRLRPEMVESMAENSWVYGDLKGRFLFLNDELERFVGKRVSSCTSSNSVWKISKDGLLVNSRCMLYESMAEEVSIWGWPLQTAGLLTAEFSSRYFSIITGKVTEWSSGEAGYFVRAANSSWVQEKWSSSVVQFDANTWILEYRQSFLLENARPVSATLKFLMSRLTRDLEKMRQNFWLIFACVGRPWDIRRQKRRTILTPT